MGRSSIGFLDVVVLKSVVGVTVEERIMRFHANEKIPDRGWLSGLIHLDWLKVQLYCAVCHYLYGWEWRFWQSQRPFPMCPCDYHVIGRSADEALKDVSFVRTDDWLKADGRRRELMKPYLEEGK